MSLETILSVGLTLVTLATGGLGWWCKTLWEKADAAQAEARAAKAEIATIRLECVERDASIWSAVRTFQTEVARDYAGRGEIQKLRDDLMGEFRRLEDKLDRLTERS